MIVGGQFSPWITLERPFTASPGIPALVSALVHHFTALWWECDTTLPGLWRVYTPSEQADHEREVDRFLEQASPVLQRPPQAPDERLEAQDRLMAVARQAARGIFGFEDRHLEALNISAFADIVVEFAHMARRFNPQVSAANIYQAGRNVVTTNMLQLLWGMPVELTTAIFAYSMLYPYSDNTLDDPTLTARDKLAFSERFYRRLLGEEVSPANANEGRIFDLVTLIEGHYERVSFPQVYESLLAIHRAQTRSLRLMRPNASPYEVDVLGISLEKGGTATLADGFLAAGDLTPLQAEFAFGLGAFLQLGDDLEDVLRDPKDSIQTMFTQTARCWPLDALTNRTMHLGLKVFDLLEPLGAPVDLREFVLMSAFQPFVTAIHRARKLYTKRYLREIESRSAFRFPHLDRQRKWLYRHRPALGMIIEM